MCVCVGPAPPPVSFQNSERAVQQQLRKDDAAIDRRSAHATFFTSSRFFLLPQLFTSMPLHCPAFPPCRRRRRREPPSLPTNSVLPSHSSSARSLVALFVLLHEIANFVRSHLTTFAANIHLHSLSHDNMHLLPAAACVCLVRHTRAVLMLSR